MINIIVVQRLSNASSDVNKAPILNFMGISMISFIWTLPWEFFYLRGDVFEEVHHEYASKTSVLSYYKFMTT